MGSFAQLKLLLGNFGLTSPTMVASLDLIFRRHYCCRLLSLPHWPRKDISLSLRMLTYRPLLALICLTLLLWSTFWDALWLSLMLPNHSLLFQWYRNAVSVLLRMMLVRISCHLLKDIVSILLLRYYFNFLNLLRVVPWLKKEVGLLNYL